MSKAMNFYLDKNISRKYGQKPLSTTNDALNTASKMAIQKTTQTTSGIWLEIRLQKKLQGLLQLVRI